MSLFEITGSVLAILLTGALFVPLGIALRYVLPVFAVGIAVVAAVMGFYSLALTHFLLATILTIRLVQLRELLAFATESHAGVSADWLTPSMTLRRHPAGTSLFKAGDISEEMFVVKSGQIRLVEVDFTLGPGTMMGEIGIFSSERKRTASAVCDTDVEILSITAGKVFELFSQRPFFAFQMMQLIIRRMNERVMRHMDEQRAIEMRAAEEKVRTRLELADGFEASVQRVFSGVTKSVENMQFCATTMTSASDDTIQRSKLVSDALDTARQSTQSMANAANGLSDAIFAIGRDVSRSAEIAHRAVTQASETNQTVQGLSVAAERINQVVNLINEIASQTNLLALNATIEAARAGEAGKGFAVVASEVKNLANQTAKATEEIAAQIGEMQRATGQVVVEIKEIGEIISSIDEITDVISKAVEHQQGASVAIARNVQEAASGTDTVSKHVSEINASVGESSQVAAQVLMTASDLSRDANILRDEVNSFSSRVRAT
jgi:methyl-accepting chemotaxis protein